jgi:hypothetical protein
VSLKWRRSRNGSGLEADFLVIGLCFRCMVVIAGIDQID